MTTQELIQKYAEELIEKITYTDDYNLACIRTSAVLTSFLAEYEAQRGAEIGEPI